MKNSGLIEFGAHTHSHAILTLLSSAEKLLEIEKSIEAVEVFTGKKCIKLRLSQWAAAGL